MYNVYQFRFQCGNGEFGGGMLLIGAESIDESKVFIGDINKRVNNGEYIFGGEITSLKSDKKGYIEGFLYLE